VAGVKRSNQLPCRFCAQRVDDYERIYIGKDTVIYCSACLKAAVEFCRSAADLVRAKRLTADELCTHFSNGTAQDLLLVPQTGEQSRQKARWVTCAKCRKAVPYTAPWPMVTAPGTGEFSGRRLCDSCARVPVEAATSSDDDIPY
jgi:hypothetical protein